MHPLAPWVGVPLCAALLLSQSCCTEDGSRYTTHERQIEARTEGDLPICWRWLDDGTLLALAPIHAASGRREFSAARLNALTHADGPRLWLTVAVWRFSGVGPPVALGRDGLPLVAETASGKVASVPTSNLLAPVADPAVKPLIGALVGAGPLAELEAGHSLQIAAALPTGATLAELASVQVELPGGAVALERARVSALQWDEFRSQPTRARFEALLGIVAAAGAGDGNEGVGGSEREPEK